MRYPCRVADDVVALGRWWGVMAYLVLGSEPVLVDTGPSGHASKIVAAIRSAGINPTTITPIVLTHFDYDHSGSARQVADELRAPVAIHKADASLLVQPQKCSGLRQFLYHPPFPRLLRWRPLRADIELSSGDTLGDWRVLHTPGHTPGSISLVRDTVGLVGDALVYRNRQLRPNVWHLSTNHAQELASDKLLANSGLYVVLPGHYAPSTDPRTVKKLASQLAHDPI
jgi:glyoxylase-like metal-dependent hydrolase (beta-lactamase superfamily II)